MRSPASDLPTILANQRATPPKWARLERQLIEVMEQAAQLKVRRYSERGGVPYYADDIYEMLYNWDLFYSIATGTAHTVAVTLVGTL